MMINDGKVQEAKKKKKAEKGLTAFAYRNEKDKTLLRPRRKSLFLVPFIVSVRRTLHQSITRKWKSFQTKDEHCASNYQF